MTPTLENVGSKNYKCVTLHTLSTWFMNHHHPKLFQQLKKIGTRYGISIVLVLSIILALSKVMLGIGIIVSLTV